MQDQLIAKQHSIEIPQTSFSKSAQNSPINSAPTAQQISLSLKFNIKVRKFQLNCQNYAFQLVKTAEMFRSL